MKTDILYEDNDILVVYKPAGLGVQTAKTGQQDVVSELKNYMRQCGKRGRCSRAAGTGVPYLGIIHRLDQPVEGLLVFAKNKKAAASLSGQLQEQANGGTLHKQYYAVICGKPAAEEGELVDYLYKNKENMAEAAAGPEVSGAKRAVLRYRILRVCSIENLSGGEIAENVMAMETAECRPGSVRAAEGIGRPGRMRTAESGKESGSRHIALADIRIQTGRFHQIRAQMALAGTPILGDFKYGNEETKALSQQLRIQHVALCAYSLMFLHPCAGKEMRFQIEPRGRAFSFLHE